jgi:hypothetical protein
VPRHEHCPSTEEDLNRILSIALVVAVCAAGFACDDGNSTETDTTTDTGTDTGIDTTDTDVPDDVVEDSVEDTVGDVGTDTNWPSTYTPEQLTYIDTITIPDVEAGVPACCADFGAISRDNIESGTDVVDNAFAVLAGALASLPGMGIDLQAEIDTSLTNGDLAILLDHRGLTGDTGTFVLVELSGTFDGTTTYVEASAGTGEFLIERESLSGGTSVPTYFFDPAQMESRAMTAGPDEFKIMGTFGFLSFPLVLQQSLLTGTATIRADGISYVNGTIAGYALLTDVFAELNAVALAAGCDCLGITDDVFTQGSDGGWDAACVSDAATLCDTLENSVCATLAGDNLATGQVCGMLPTLLEGSADIDADGDDSTYEALSFGLEWTGKTATINGIEP